MNETNLIPYFLNSGSIFHIEKKDILILKNLNLVYNEMRGKSAFSINSSNLYVKFNDEIIGIIKFNQKVVVIRPKIKNFDFNYIIRMWSYLNFSNFKNLSLEIPYFKFTFQNNRINIGDLFIKALFELIQKGLYGKYIEYEVETSFKKGRINYKKKFYKFYYEGKFYCSSDEFTINNFLNQMINYCLNKIKFSITEQILTNKTVYLLNFFKNITLLSSIDLNKIDSIILNRQNNYYRNIIALCKIIIKNLSITSIEGTSPNYSFLFDFNYLFEEFIKCILSLYSIRNDFQYWRDFRNFGAYFKENGDLVIKRYLPDILFKYDDISDSAKVVIDVKNKFNGIFLNNDIYQLVFYCNALKTNTGIFIYPSIEPKDVIPFYFTLSGKKYNLFALFFPLGGNDIEFYQNIKSFINNLYDILEHKIF